MFATCLNYVISVLVIAGGGAWQNQVVMKRAVCCRWWSMALNAALVGTTWCTMLAGTQGESYLVLQNQLGVSTHGTSLFQDKWLVAPTICPDEANL